MRNDGQEFSQYLLNFWEQISDQEVDLCHLPAGPHHHHPSCSVSHHSHALFCRNLHFHCLVQNTDVSLKPTVTGMLETTLMTQHCILSLQYLANLKHAVQSNSPGGSLKYYHINLLFAVLQPAQQPDGVASSSWTSRQHSVPSTTVPLPSGRLCLSSVKKGFWMVAPVLAVCIFICCYAKI